LSDFFIGDGGSGYVLSDDYEKLFQLICEPLEIFCVINDAENVKRLCRVLRLDEFDIIIGSEGRQYSSVNRFHEQYGSELDVFVKACESINLMFVPPNEIKLISRD